MAFSVCHCHPRECRVPGVLPSSVLYLSPPVWASTSCPTLQYILPLCDAHWLPKHPFLSLTHPPLMWVWALQSAPLYKTTSSFSISTSQTELPFPEKGLIPGKNERFSTCWRLPVYVGEGGWVSQAMKPGLCNLKPPASRCVVYGQAARLRVWKQRKYRLKHRRRLTLANNRQRPGQMDA